ncbi:MAG TPA: E2/UBC family protein [Gaiellaceae bacterium]|nr:E2/UBC family protein [Gaiellaceae bacterium]
MLRECDKNHLDEIGLTYSIYEQGEITLLVLEGYELPVGCQPAAVDVLIAIPSTYPDGALDMWWTYPYVVFAPRGQAPVNTDVRQPYSGYTPDPARQWQRWSRHPQWRAGTDDLRSFLRAMRTTLETEAQRVAA